MNIKRYIKKHQALFYSLKLYVLYLRYVISFFHRRDYSDILQLEYKSTFEIKQRGWHCFFGYYDKSPMDINNERIVFLRIKDNVLSQAKGEVCIYNIKSGETEVIGHTSAWNWQQAAMMQWIDENTVSYNMFDEESRIYQTVWVNVETGKEKKYLRAAYSYNKSHTKYLSLNFYRLDKFAKGYGYPYEVDAMDNMKDGIWETTINNNASQLILSIQDVINYRPKDYLNCQHYINHVAYCPNERFVIFIHRWQVEGGEFISRLLKYDLMKKELMVLLDNGHVSHYCWKSANELLIYATNAQNRKGYMILDIESAQTRMFNGLPFEDGHPSYSPDGKWILTDSYPNNRRDQHVFLYNTVKNVLYKLDRLHSPIRYYNENRCDLHPRWNFNGECVLIDSTDIGFRSIKIYGIKRG